MNPLRPQISVVIPAHNRPGPLQACLAALSDSSFPGDAFEVVIVDDGSRMSLDSVVDPYRQSMNVTLISQPNAGPAAARNAGAEAASGAFLIFTDDDCLPEPDWLPSLASALSENPEALVGGRTVNLLVDNPFAAVSQQLISYIYEYYNDDSGKTCFFATNNLAVSRARLLALGGFSTRFPYAAGEDRDFCERWTQSGYDTHYIPEAVIRHAHDLTFSEFWKQHFNYGRGAHTFHRHRLKKQAAIAPEPLSFYTDLLSYPLRAGNSGNVAIHLALMALSQAAGASGYAWEAVQAGRSVRNRTSHGEEESLQI